MSIIGIIACIFLAILLVTAIGFISVGIYIIGGFAYKRRRS